MKIESSTVALAANTKKAETHYKRERMEVAHADGTTVTMTKEEGYIEDQVTLSDEVRSIQQSASEAGRIGTTGFDFNMSDHEAAQIELLTRMIQALTGKKMKFVMPNEYMKDSFKSEASRMEAQRFALRLSGGSGNSGGSRGGVIGVRYESSEIHAESETMNFAATGTIRTADGREIQFSAALSMNREFVERTDKSFQKGVMNVCDPLVINFDSAGTDLTDTKFSFDLDCDGINDSISFVGEGSGFLALDINGDGVINDGSELFGTRSGDGFADLAAYDQDGNGWIDENDDIYDKLRIWTKDKDGNDRLMALGAKGIGAIYLGSTKSDFTVKNANNDSLGLVRKTGIFLKENGGVGTVQHVDLCL